MSALGFGLARLPSDRNDPELIDEILSAEMIRAAIDCGVNLIDAGAVRNSARREAVCRAAGQGLGEEYRARVLLSAGLSIPHDGTLPDMESVLNRQLEHLQTDCIDLYSLEWLDRENLPRLRESGILAQAEKAIAGGRIGALGFGFHDHFRFLREAISSSESWSFARFRYSFMDVDHHPGISGLRFAAEQGLGIIVTEPLLRGRLTRNIPTRIADIWDSAEIKRPPAEWGLSWVLNHAGISSAVCDMSTPEQLRQNLALAENTLPDSLSIRDEVTVGKVRDAYRALRPVPCTACRNCMPCPNGIDAPRIFEVYNDAVMYSDTETARSIYYEEEHDRNDCTGCGLCAERCGRNIDLPGWLNKASDLFSG